MPDTCTSFWSEIGHRYCGETAIGTLTQSCVHEHISSRPVCAGCAADIQRAAGDMICRACDEDAGDDGHECPVLMVIDWCDGTSTTVQEAWVA